MENLNDRRTPKGLVEDKFRREVRYALDLDIFVRDDQIIAEIEKLKARIATSEARVASECQR